AAIVAVDFVLIDEASRAAFSDADAKAGEQVIEGNDFGLAARYFERCDGGISQPHLRSPWESGKMNSGTLAHVGTRQDRGSCALSGGKSMPGKRLRLATRHFSCRYDLSAGGDQRPPRARMARSLCGVTGRRVIAPGIPTASSIAA